METYRLSSKLRERDREYLIQTANDAVLGTVNTSVYADGVPTETTNRPHPSEISPQQVLSVVKMTHGEKRIELEALLKAYKEFTASGDLESMHQLGMAFFFKRLYVESIELFRSVVALKPDHHQALNQLGAAYLAAGRFDEAIASSRKAVSLRSEYADYRNNLGEAYLANNQASEALSEFEKAISINMYYGDAYLNLGLASLLEAISHPSREKTPAQIQRSVDCFKRAALIHPEHKLRSEFEEGIAALGATDLTRALNCFKALREGKKEGHRQEFAALYMKFVLHPEWITEQSVEERITFLEAELKRNPSYVDLQAELAQCYLQQARILWRKGTEQFKKAVDANSSLTHARESLTIAEKVQTGLEEALNRIAGKG